MISLVDIAQSIETGLNAQLDNPDILFKIWAYAGEEQALERTGNTVKHYIEGTLIRTGSANDAARIPMGANALYLEFFVPIEAPRTQAGTTPTDRIVEGQYPFLDEIISAVDNYFTAATTMTDSGFTLSIQGAMSTTGAPQLIPGYGLGVTITVGIDLIYVEGGINSRALLLTVDGAGYIVPFLTTSLAMSHALETDVQAGSNRRKSWASAKAVDFSVTIPATTGTLTEAVFDALFGQAINVAHFVSLSLDGATYDYLMLIDAPSIDAQGVTNIGVTAEFIEVIDAAEVISVPSAYQVGRFAFANSTATSFTFVPNNAGMGYIAGEVVEFLTGENVQVALSPGDFVWDDEEGTYFVYLITNRAVEIQGSDFEVVKEAGNA